MSPERLTRPSEDHVQAVMRRFVREFPDAVLIGGWASYLRARVAKSHDIDIIVDHVTLGKLGAKFQLAPSRHISGQQFAFEIDGVGVDVYPVYQSKLGRRLQIPVEVLKLGTDAVAIDERIAPEPGEHVIVKKHASAFFGTNLASMLRAAGVDTVIVTGVTMAGCVRHTVEDAIGYGFRPIVVRECVGDRVAGVVEWNLFDIDAKFGDVEPLERVLEYLAGIAPFESRVEIRT